MRWGVWGGPITASITAFGGEKALADLFSKLRCPVEIYDDQGRACWWGYISSVSYSVGNFEISVSLDRMANRVSVAYSFVAAGTQTVGMRKTTAWADDTASQAIYGTKEYQSSASGLTDAVAEAQRDVILALRKLPQPSASMMGGGNVAQPYVTIECRGWWETLNWKYYPSGFAIGPSYLTTGASTVQSVGQAAPVMELIQTFNGGSVAFIPTSVSLYVKKTGSPASPLTIYIQTVVPNAIESKPGVFTDYITDCWYGTIPASSISTSIGWVTCTPTTTWGSVQSIWGSYNRIVVYGGSADASNYYSIGVNEALGYTDGYLRYWHSINKNIHDASLTARTPDADMLFSITAGTTINPVWLAAGTISLGEFMTGCDASEVSSTDSMTSYMDGDSTLKALAEAMMITGGPNGRRLLSTVDINRRARLYEEPAATATHLMDTTGRLMTSKGGAVVPYMPPVGVYVRIMDMLPASADLGLIADPTLQFIEGAEWSSSGGLRVEFRGERSIDELTRISQDAPRASTGFRPAIGRSRAIPKNGKIT